MCKYADVARNIYIIISLTGDMNNINVRTDEFVGICTSAHPHICTSIGICIFAHLHINFIFACHNDFLITNGAVIELAAATTKYYVKFYQ